MLVLEHEVVSQVSRGGTEGRAPGQVTQTRVGLPLGCIAVEVGHKADAEWVGTVQPLNDTQVAGCLGQALPESQPSVVHGQGVGVKVTCKGKGETCLVRKSPRGNILKQVCQESGIWKREKLRRFFKVSK